MLFRTALVMGPSVIMPRLATFITLLILTHRLPPAEFGLLSLVVLVGEAVDMTGSNWIRFTLLRLDVSKPDGWAAGLRRSYVLCAASTVLGFGAIAIVARVLAPERYLEFLFAVCAYTLSSGALRVGLTGLQMRQRNATFSLIESSRALFQVAAVFCLLLSGYGTTFFRYSLATSAVSCAMSVVAISLSWRGVAGKSGASPGYGERLRYGAVIILLTLVAQTVVGSDRFFLKIIGGPAMVGIYSAAYVFGRQPVDMIGNAINQGAFPEFMKRFDLHGRDVARLFVSDIFELLSLMVLSALAALWGIAPAIANALLPPEYRATAIILIPLIALGGSFQAFKNYVFDNIFHLYRRNWLQVMSYVPAAGVTLIAALLLIRPFGPVGAALAAISGMAASLLGSIWMTRKLLAVPVSLLMLGKTLAIACITGICGFLVTQASAGLPRFLVLAIVLSACGVAWSAAVFMLRPRALAGAIGKIEARMGFRGRPQSEM